MLNYTIKEPAEQLKQPYQTDDLGWYNKFQGGKTLLNKLLGHECNTQWLNSVSHKGS